MTTVPRDAGSLVLVPNMLDFGCAAPGDLSAGLPLAVIQRAASITHWVVEDAKTARAFIKRVAAVCELAAPLQSLQMRELPRAGASAAGRSGSECEALLGPALQGHDIGVLSEAGLAAVADPGSELVAAAHRLGVKVEPLPGSSALLLALAASGLNGQHFAFVGYLPVKDEPRAARIRALEAASRRQAQTQIAIETPYRNPALVRALLAHLSPSTRLCIACALGWREGWCRTRSIGQWRDAPPAVGERLPAVFLFQAG